MVVNGILNSRGSQFVRGVSFTRYNANEATGGPIQVAAGSAYTVGFTSGVPSTEYTAAGSGFTIPAEGLYRASAVVYVSGITPGIHQGTVLPQFGIEFTLDGAPIFHSRRNIVAASGIKTPYVGLTKLETEAIFEARGGDSLKVLVRSNSAAGGWNMVGADWYPGDGLNGVYSTPAAVLNVQRLPTTALDSDTWLT